MKINNIIIGLLTFSAIALATTALIIKTGNFTHPDMPGLAITSSTGTTFSSDSSMSGELATPRISNRFGRIRNDPVESVRIVEPIAAPSATPSADNLLLIVGRVTDEENHVWLYLKERHTNKLHKARLDGSPSGEIIILSRKDTVYEIRWNGQIFTLQGAIN